MKRKGRLIAPLAAALTAVLAVGVASAQPGGKGSNAKSGKRWVELGAQGSKPRLGVRLLDMSGDLRAYFGAPADRGVLVDSVVVDSPAAKAGLRSGDVVLVVDGDPSGEVSDVLAALSDRKKGDAVAIEIVRDKKRMTVRATLQSDPSAQASIPIDPGLPGFGLMGEDTRRRLDEIEKRLDRLEKKP